MVKGIKAQPDFGKETLLWLAGLLEGEGSFMVALHQIQAHRSLPSR